MNKSGTDEGSSSAVTSDGDDISAAVKTSEPLSAVQNDVSVNLSGDPMCMADELDQVTSVVSDDAAYHQGKEESIPQYYSPASIKRSTGSAKEVHTDKVSKDACGQVISEPDSAHNFSYEEDNNNFKFNYDSILQFIKQGEPEIFWF